ncbi:hypothetical protein HS088_TW10G00135 [Tripterygium wilfordii]|uniref:Uncharacterized protein n=1 Tax=Tripterygium wilfordii TaxID=458696 RepID=A0A7J7D475_TRIWF|nr:hypothetical protein HS088_TW10G00135 [Tripterygium wilfordii]
MSYDILAEETLLTIFTVIVGSSILDDNACKCLFHISYVFFSLTCTEWTEERHGSISTSIVNTFLAGQLLKVSSCLLEFPETNICPMKCAEESADPAIFKIHYVVTGS